MTIYQLFLETSPGYQEFDPQIMVDDEVSSDVHVHWAASPWIRPLKRWICCVAEAGTVPSPSSIYNYWQYSHASLVSVFAQSCLSSPAMLFLHNYCPVWLLIYYTQANSESYCVSDLLTNTHDLSMFALSCWLYKKLFFSSHIFKIRKHPQFVSVASWISQYFPNHVPPLPTVPKIFQITKSVPKRRHFLGEPTRAWSPRPSCEASEVRPEIETWGSQDVQNAAYFRAYTSIHHYHLVMTNSSPWLKSTHV